MDDDSHLSQISQRFGPPLGAAVGVGYFLLWARSVFRHPVIWALIFAAMFIWGLIDGTASFDRLPGVIVGAELIFGLIFTFGFFYIGCPGRGLLVGFVTACIQSWTEGHDLRFSAMPIWVIALVIATIVAMIYVFYRYLTTPTIYETRQPEGIIQNIVSLIEDIQFRGFSFGMIPDFVRGVRNNREYNAKIRQIDAENQRQQDDYQQQLADYQRQNGLTVTVDVPVSIETQPEESFIRGCVDAFYEGLRSLWAEPEAQPSNTSFCFRAMVFIIVWVLSAVFALDWVHRHLF